MKNIPAIVLIALPLTVAAEISYTLDDKPTSYWVGGDATKPYNWDVPSNWSDNTVPVVDTWRNVHFNLSSATSVDFGAKYASDNDNAAFAIVVDKGSEQLTISQSAVDTLKLYATGDGSVARTSFVNLSSKAAIFDIKVQIYGYRHYDSGIHPGGQFNKTLEFNAGNPKFVFFSGDETMDTTVCKLGLVSNKPVEIQTCHVVKIDGSSAYMTATNITVAGELKIAGGTLNATDLATVGDGVVSLEDGARLAVSKDISGVNFSISGSVTIDNGEYEVDLSGATFAEGSCLSRTGTGTVILPSSGELPFVVARYTTNRDEGQEMTTWLGADATDPNRWDRTANWSNDVPLWNFNTSAHVWRWANFSLDKAAVIELGDKMAGKNDSASSLAPAAFGMVVQAGSKQVKLVATKGGYSERFNLWGGGSGRTSFVNYSAYPVVFDVPAGVTGSRDGASGVLPGAVYNKDFFFDTQNDGTVMTFFAGDALVGEARNTTSFKGALKADNWGKARDVSIEQDHVVVFDGSSSSLTAKNVTVGGVLRVLGGTVTVTNLVTTGAGRIVLDSAMVAVTGGLSGNIHVDGIVKIDHGEAGIDISNMTFADGAKIELVGTGTVVKDESKAYPFMDEYIKFNKSGDNSFWMNAKENWGDGVSEISADKEYFVDARTAGTTVRAKDSTDAESVFPGKSISLLGAGYNDARLMLKGDKLTVRDLYMCARSVVWLGQQSATVNADIHVMGPKSLDDSGAVRLQSEWGRTLTLNGSLYGDGAIRLVADNEKEPVGAFALAADNPDFTGPVQVYGSNTTARFSTALAFGSNPAEPVLKGLEIVKATVEFTASSDLDINQPNRGLYVTESAAIAANIDITWRGPVAFSSDDAVLVKSGTGDLSFAGKASSAGVVEVAGGNVYALGKDSAGMLSISAESAGKAYLPAVAAPTAGEIAARKFAAKDWLLVPDGSVDSTPEENLRRMTDRGWLVLKKYGLENRWVVEMGQHAVDGGVMLTVSGKIRSFAVVIR